MGNVFMKGKFTKVKAAESFHKFQIVERKLFTKHIQAKINSSSRKVDTFTTEMIRKE